MKSGSSVYWPSTRSSNLGQIVKVDAEEKEVVIRYDQREVVYDFGELDEEGVPV